MNKYEVVLTYGTHYVVADDYSVSGGFYLFWVGSSVVRSFPVADVIEVKLQGRAYSTERQR